MNASCGIFLSHEIFLKDTASRWLRLAVTDAAFMRSLMLTAARHLSQQSQSWPPGHHLQQYYQTLASQYKVASLQAVIQVIPEAASTRHVTDAILAIVMVLASDEVSLSVDRNVPVTANWSCWASVVAGKSCNAAPPYPRGNQDGRSHWWSRQAWTGRLSAESVLQGYRRWQHAQRSRHNDGDHQPASCGCV